MPRLVGFGDWESISISELRRRERIGRSATMDFDVDTWTFVDRSLHRSAAMRRA